MEFEEYLNSQFGSHVSDLNEQQISSLKQAYDKLLIWQNISMTTLNKGLNSKNDIDYTNDYEKSMKTQSELSQKLALLVSQIKMSLGIEETEDISRHHM